MVLLRACAHAFIGRATLASACGCSGGQLSAESAGDSLEAAAAAFEALGSVVHRAEQASGSAVTGAEQAPGSFETLSTAVPGAERVTIGGLLRTQACAAAAANARLAAARCVELRGDWGTALGRYTALQSAPAPGGPSQPHPASPGGADDAQKGEVGGTVRWSLQLSGSWHRQQRRGADSESAVPQPPPPPQSSFVRLAMAPLVTACGAGLVAESMLGEGRCLWLLGQRRHGQARLAAAAAAVARAHGEGSWQAAAAGDALGQFLGQVAEHANSESLLKVSLSELPWMTVRT